MDQHLPSLLLSAHALAAGLTFQLAATQLFRWRCRREDAAAFRLGLVASSLTAVLLVNTWLLQAPPTQVDAALFLRSVLFLVTIVLLVPTVATFVDRPAPRAGLRLLAVLCVIRLALWVSTDLVSQHAVDADGAPRYGSLVAVTSVPLVALLVLLVVRLARHWHDTVERAAFFAGLIASMAILLLSLAVRDGPLAELLTGLLVLPLVVGLQVIAARRTAQTEHASQLAAAQRRAVSEELARSERRSTLALLAGGMGWYEWDPQTRALAASPEFAQILGVAPEQIPATIDKLLEYVHPEDRRGIGVAIDGTPMIGHEAEDFRVVRPDGAVLWIEANGRTVTGQDGQVEVLGVVRDITERKRAEEELTHLATHDPLTGLANRPALTKCVGEHLERDEPFALLLMDLNGFKDVNDTLGHPVGDEVLVAVARRLETTLRASDVLTRIGGDEFAIIVPDRREAAERIGHHVLGVLDRPVQIGGVAITVHASLGIVHAPDDGQDVDTLLRRADAAMYRAKSRGGGIHVYAEDDDQSATRRLHLAGRLEGAIAKARSSSTTNRPSTLRRAAAPRSRRWPAGATRTSGSCPQRSSSPWRSTTASEAPSPGASWPTRWPRARSGGPTVWPERSP